MLETIQNTNTEIFSGEKTNPFPGLRAFNREEKDNFFGREKQVGELLGKLRSNRLLAVVGTSGSGKTSLVRCGLLPRLAEGFSAHAGDEWRVAMFSPGKDPIGNMCAALAEPGVLENSDKVEPNFQTYIENTLRSGGLGLANLYQKSAIKNQANLLLVIDQFEEIFKFNQEEKNRGGYTNDSLAFINLLLYVNRQRNMPVYIVLTMRSDFLGDTAEFRGLPEAINDGQMLIPRMRRQELRQAITKPLVRQGVQIEPSLVSRILDEVPDNQDQLPLLQHCLMRMWEKWEEEDDMFVPISDEHYQAIGGIATALSDHAEEAYEELRGDEDRELCAKLFKILTEKGRDGLETRRPATFRELIALTGASRRDVLEVIDIFGGRGRSFLDAPLVSDIELDTTINIAHESLMRAWTRLSKWVWDEAQSVETYMRLSEAAELYYSGQAGFWRTPELQIGINWRELAHPTEQWASRYNDSFASSMEFLRLSEKDYNDKLAAEEEARQEELRTAGRRAKLSMMAGMVGLALAALATVFYMKALVSQNEALKSKLHAKDEERKAREREIDALEAKQLALEKSMEAERALALAKKKEREAVSSAERALAAEQVAKKSEELAKVKEAEALASAKLARIKEAESVASEKLAKQEAENADLQASIAKLEAEKAKREREKAERLRILNKVQKIAAKAKDVEDYVLGALLAKESYDVNRAYNGNENDPDIYDALHQSVQKLYGSNYNQFSSSSPFNHRGSIHGVVSEAGGKLFTTGADGRLVYWNTSVAGGGARLLNENIGSGYRTMSLNSNNGLLVCGGNMPVWEVYNLNNSAEPLILKGHDGGSSAVVMRPRRKGFYSVGMDGTLMHCDMEHDAEVVLNNGILINALDISGLGVFLAAGDRSGRVTIYKTTAGGSVHEFKTKQFGKEVSEVKFSPDKKHLAVGLKNGGLWIWNWKRGGVTKHEAHTSEVSSVAYNADGSNLLTASFDGKVKVWETALMDETDYLPIVLPHNTWVTSAAFVNGVNGRVVTGTRKGKIKIWDIDAEVLAGKICPKLERNLTKEEWDKYVGLDEDERLRGQTCVGKPMSKSSSGL